MKSALLHLDADVADQLAVLSFGGAYQDAQRPWTRADVIVAGTRPEGDVDGDVLWVPGKNR